MMTQEERTLFYSNKACTSPKNGDLCEFHDGIFKYENGIWQPYNETSKMDKLKAEKKTLEQKIKDAEKEAHEEEHLKLKGMLNLILKDLVEDQNATFLINHPNYTKGKIEVSIKSIDFSNLFWKPIKTKVITEGLLVEETYTVEEPVWGMNETHTVIKKRKVPLKEMLCQLEWFNL